MGIRLRRLARHLCISFALTTGAWSCTAGGSPQHSTAEQIREDALARASVFRDTARPDILRAEWQPLDVACRFLPVPTSGTTPKFTCALADGTHVKVKYGTTHEVPAELAASELLRALGFGADHLRLAARVRCYGCPAAPFYVRKLADSTPLGELVRGTPDYTAYRDFTWAAVEQKLAGGSIEGDTAGWSFWELDKIDHARGGATREEVDALRLIAVFLAHWDNKPGNQRLTCLEPGAAGRCDRPLVMLQDVGATFGPRKVDLDDWRRTPVWADERGCRVTMASLPHDGATFSSDVWISEGGRRLLAGRLSALTPSDIAALFVHARFPGPIDQWVDAFADKVARIAGRSC
jgi:hypothetical protein